MNDKISKISASARSAETENITLQRNLQAKVVELQCEKTMAEDTAALLAQSRQREAELMDERQSLQTDLDTIDQQLADSQSALGKTNGRVEVLEAQLMRCDELLATLEIEKDEWLVKEQQLSGNAGVKQEEWVATRRKLEDLENQLSVTKDKIKNLDQDLKRSQEKLMDSETQLVNAQTTFTTQKYAVDSSKNLFR